MDSLLFPEEPFDDDDDYDEDLSALDTLEFAGVLESGEFDSVPQFRPRTPLRDDDPLAGSGSPLADESGDVTAVELVKDTEVEMGVLDPADVGVALPGIDAMPLYEQLRLCCSSEFASVAVQLATRSGRVIVSSIADPDRRRKVAEFSRQAVEILTPHELDAQHALVHAVDLYVFVVAVDEVRTFTALFHEQPVLDDLLAVLRPHLHGFRRRRGEC